MGRGSIRGAWRGHGVRSILQGCRGICEGPMGFQRELRRKGEIYGLGRIERCLGEIGMGGIRWGKESRRIYGWGSMGGWGQQNSEVGNPWIKGIHGGAPLDRGVYRDPKWDPLQGSCRAPWREDGKGGPSTGVREKILRDLEEGYRYRSGGRASAGRCVQELGIHVGSGEIQVHPEWVRIHGEEVQSRGSGRVRSSKGIGGDRGKIHGRASGEEGSGGGRGRDP